MQKRNQSGFTLVELVVVIAVLAILAGVGAVAYSGYIEKANEAADQELIGAVNTAFAAACAETGVEGHPTEAVASLKQKKVNQVTADDVSGFNDAFFMYFEGNEDKEFQVVEGLIYNKDGGFFYASLNGGNTILLGKGNSLINEGKNPDGSTKWTWKKGEQEIEFTSKEEDIQKFIESSFGKNVGIDNLMQEVDKLAVAMSNVTKDSTPDDYLTKELQEKLAAVYTDTNSEEYKKAAANALVVQAAMHSDTWTSEDIVQFMRTGNFYGSMPENQEGDGQYAYLASLTALQYAMVTAYAKSDVGSSTNIKIQGDGFDYNGPIGEFYEKNVSDIINNGAMPSQAYGGISKLFEAMVKTGEYQTYLDAEGQKDIDGYLGAMEFIRDNQDAIIDNRVMDNGFGDSELTDMLNALFG